ncbi:MAG: hypothetical protein KC646_17470 [Candidatus Cloacimonetes bacterium]|nr:hypothetical protein [Candidatus Cloacimonadota bacterium]
MKQKIFYIIIQLLFIQCLVSQTQLPKHIKSTKYCTAIFQARLFRESPVFKTVKKEIYHHEIKLNHKLDDKIALKYFAPSKFSHYMADKEIQLFHFPKYFQERLKADYIRFDKNSLSIRFNDSEKTLEEYFINDDGVLWPKSQMYHYHFYKDGVGHTLQLSIKFIDFVYAGPRLEILKSLIPKNL